MGRVCYGPRCPVTCILILLLHLIRVYAIFYSTFSNNLAILLAISDTTAYQTAPSNQGLHDKLFCRFKQTRKNGDKILGRNIREYTVYPDHTATSNPGLRNFLFYFFN